MSWTNKTKATTTLTDKGKAENEVLILGQDGCFLFGQDDNQLFSHIVYTHDWTDKTKIT